MQCSWMFSFLLVVGMKDLHWKFVFSTNSCVNYAQFHRKSIYKNEKNVTLTCSTIPFSRSNRSFSPLTDCSSAVCLPSKGRVCTLKYVWITVIFRSHTAMNLHYLNAYLLTCLHWSGKWQCLGQLRYWDRSEVVFTEKFAIHAKNTKKYLCKSKISMLLLSEAVVLRIANEVLLYLQ